MRSCHAWAWQGNGWGDEGLLRWCAGMTRYGRVVVSGSWLEAGTLLIMENQQLTRFHAGFITDHHRLTMHEATAVKQHINEGRE